TGTAGAARRASFMTPSLMTSIAPVPIDVTPARLSRTTTPTTTTSATAPSATLKPTSRNCSLRQRRRRRGHGARPQRLLEPPRAGERRRAVGARRQMRRHAPLGRQLAVGDRFDEIEGFVAEHSFASRAAPPPLAAVAYAPDLGSNARLLSGRLCYFNSVSSSRRSC